MSGELELAGQTVVVIGGISPTVCGALLTATRTLCRSPVGRDATASGEQILDDPLLLHGDPSALS